ncbi:hypothetical protein ACPXB3_22130 [Gordonia sp. DT219]
MIHHDHSYIGRHRRSDIFGDDIFEQVIVSGGHAWRWDDARHTWKAIA